MIKEKIMQKYLDYLKRHLLWIVTGIIGAALLQPSLGEVKTLLIIVIVESLAVALSGFAQYVYTQIDFTRDSAVHSLGMIFLGVHILVGLTILGVFLAQFAG